MAGFALVGAFGAELVNKEFVALAHWFGDLKSDSRAFDVGDAEFGVAAGGAEDEDFVDFDFVADFGFAAVVEVDVDGFTFGHFALAAGFFDDCVGI